MKIENKAYLSNNGPTIVLKIETIEPYQKNAPQMIMYAHMPHSGKSLKKISKSELAKVKKHMIDPEKDERSLLQSRNLDS